MSELKTEKYMFLPLKKGMKFEIPNPQWDEENPETQFMVTIQLEENAGCLLTGGQYKYTFVSNPSTQD